MRTGRPSLAVKLASLHGRGPMLRAIIFSGQNGNTPMGKRSVTAIVCPYFAVRSMFALSFILFASQSNYGVLTLLHIHSLVNSFFEFILTRLVYLGHDLD